MSTITPFLWFDDNLEEAMNFYTSVFKDAKIIHMGNVGQDGLNPGGRVTTATFELEGQRFMGLNGGPTFKFNESISFFVTRDTQEEIDELWGKLTADGGSESQCGWLKDKFGLSWQIVPANLSELLGNPDPAKAKRTLEAMLKMNKLDIKKLQDA